MNSTEQTIEVESLVNAREAAEVLGVSERWVRDHATRRTPRVPCVRLGSLIKFRLSDLAKFIERQMVPPEPSR
jgi:predicted DNA-binding transcriptional regulator AlpA